jgi:hypothetical protein
MRIVWFWKVAGPGLEGGQVAVLRRRDRFTH